MKLIKYFFQFLIISFLLIIFKLLGLKNGSKFGHLVGNLLGPFFRSKKKNSFKYQKSYSKY